MLRGFSKWIFAKSYKVKKSNEREKKKKTNYGRQRDVK